MFSRSKAVLVVVVSLQVCVMTVMILSNFQSPVTTSSSTGQLIEDGTRHKYRNASDPFMPRDTSDPTAVPEQRMEKVTETMVRGLQQLRDGQTLSHVLHSENRYASQEDGSSNNSFDVQTANTNLVQNISHERKEYQEAASSESKDVRILGRLPHRISIHGSDKMFISVKYSDMHTERLLPMMLTWLQTVDGRQVIQHSCMLQYLKSACHVQLDFNRAFGTIINIVLIYFSCTSSSSVNGCGVGAISWLGM